MKMKDLFKGYVWICLEGQNQQKAVNMAMARGMAVWDVSSRDGARWELKTTVEGFKAMARLARRSGCRARVLRKEGMPFLLRRLRRRKAFVAGAVIFCAGLFVLSRFVWSVDVKISGDYDPGLILRAAERYGVYPGCLRTSLNAGRFQESMLAAFPDMSWAGLHFQGTHILVEVVEKIGESPDQAAPGDMVAGEAGVIQEILVLKGVGRVREGDRVAAGQVLIEGLFYPKYKWSPEGRLIPDSEPSRVQSQGIVRALVTRESYGECPLEEVEMIETGKEKVERILVVFNRPIRLTGGGGPDFEFARRVSERKIVFKGRNPEQIIELNTVIQKEQERVIRSRGLDGAYEEAQARAFANMEARLPDEYQVTEKYYSMEPSGDEGIIKVQLTLVTVEDIGTR
ncbi:MAG: sporulation protein YqfD [Peptococcaceae bacterium]|jgi:similar to stage IV sporulation protein|nr:sporulation protein YqfD [Peptococcaceae bacterium]